MSTGPEPLEILYRSRGPALRRFAARLTQDPDAAADLVQDAFVRARTARNAPTDEDQLYFYVLRILVNLARSRGRRAAVAARAVSWLRTDEPAADAGDDGRVLAAVAALPRRQREVVFLRYWLDLDVAATAAILGIAPGSVKTHSSRAIAHLRDLLGETAELGDG